MKKKVALIVSKLFIFYYKIIFGKRVSFGKNVLVLHKFLISGPGKVVIGDNCNLWSNEEPNKFYSYSTDSVVRVGEGSRLNGITVHCRESVTLGSNCISGSAIIMDNDIHEITNSSNILYGNVKCKPVLVGNNVWLCGQSVLLKGSGVGNNSVVGFRAVVTKTFPSDVVIAGNPARIVKSKYVKS